MFSGSLKGINILEMNSNCMCLHKQRYGEFTTKIILDLDLMATGYTGLIVMGSQN